MAFITSEIFEITRAGFRLVNTIRDTESGALELFKDRDDVCLVRATPIFGRPGIYDFAVLVKHDVLCFDCPDLAEQFAQAVVAAGFEATVRFDKDAEFFNDPYKFDVIYTGPQVTKLSTSPYSPLGRKASRFTRQ